MNIEKKLNNFINKVIGIDLFKKLIKNKKDYNINTSTLVPFSLILGPNIFNKYLIIYNHFIKTEQNYVLLDLEQLINKKMIENENNNFGEYLKFFGLSKINLNPLSLLPIGILFSLYKLYLMKKNEQKSLKDKVYNIIDKKLFLIYNRFLSIKELSSTTLVPISFILGNKAFKYYIIDDILINNSISKLGDVRIPNKYKFLKDKILIQYLNIIKLNINNLKMNTLFPLGLLIMLFDIYIN